MNVNCKRFLSFLLVCLLMLGLPLNAMAATVDTTEPTEPTIPAETEPLPMEPTEPQKIISTEPDTTDPIADGTEPPNTVGTDLPVTEETAPDEELSLALMSLDDGIASIAETEIVGAPNAFGNIFLLNGGIDIPSYDHVQHKEHLPLYSVYLKDQPGYENNYYVAYCIEPGVVLGESGGHSGSSTTVGGMTDGTGALERLSREQVEAMGVVLMYGQREIARRANDESVRLQKLARHAATQVLIWEIACGWRSATPPYTQYDSTFYDAIVPELECAVQVWGTKFYLDGIDDAYNEIVAQMERHYKIPSFMTSSKSTAPSYELIADGNGKYSITLTDRNNVLSKYSFTNTSDLTFSVSGNKLTVTANGPISDTLVAPTKQAPNLDSQVFYVWEYKEQQKLMSCKTEPVNSSVPAYFYVSAPDQTASLDLTKTTEDGNNLPGWEFELYSDAVCATKLSGPHVTDENGKISITGLDAGTVYVKELGHKDSAINALYSCASTNTQKVELIAGETAKVSFHNILQTGYGRIIKQTNTGENLGGRKINLYADEALTQLVAGSPFTTPDNGVIEVELLPGDYWCQEVDESDKYPYWVFDTEVKKLTIKAGETTSVTFSNTHYGRGKFIKDMPDGGSVVGWPFDLYRVSDGAFIGTFVTGEDGTVETGLLLPGQYQVYEQIPEDSLYYCDTPNPQTVTVTAGQTAEVTFTNRLKPAEIAVQKVDTSGNPLAGAVFLLEWSVDGVDWLPVRFTDSAYVTKGTCTAAGLLDGCLTSPEDGWVRFTGLHPERHYRLTEVTAPAGYQLLAGAAFEGTIPTDETLSVTLTVVNALIYELPMTGSKSFAVMAVSLFVCIAGCVGALVYLRRKGK